MLSALPAEFLGWCVFGLGSALLGVAGLLLGRRPVLLLLLALALAGTGAALLAAGLPSWVWKPALGVALLSALLCVARSTWPERLLLRALGLGRKPLAQAALLLVCGLGVLGWQLHALEHSVEGFDEARFPSLEPEINLQPLASVPAYTDAGSPVPLFSASRPEDAALTSATEEAALRNQGLERQVIQTGEADLAYNCHGWVFTGGRHWVRGSSVEQILKDNAYQAVGMPAPGDVAVFRDPKGEVQHTALVKAVAPDGMVLLESKWGQLSRYLHTAEKHSYRSCSCSYYHTPRGTHLLRGLDSSTPAPSPTAQTGAPGERGA